MTCKSVDLDIYRCIKHLFHLTDDAWGEYLLSKSPVYKKMGGSQARRLIRDAFHCAEEQFMQLQKANSIDVEAILQADAVRILVDDDDVDPSYLFFAEYEPDSRSIRLSGHAIAQVKDIMGNTHLFENVDLRRLILAHELFHHLESKQPGIYTRLRHAELKRFGRLSYHTRVAAVSEVAAVHFSKLVLGLTFNPAIMEILLVYSVDPDRAWSIANQLTEEEWGSYG